MNSYLGFSSIISFEMVQKQWRSVVFTFLVFISLVLFYFYDDLDAAYLEYGQDMKYVLRTQVFQTEQDYFAMKYSQRPLPHRLMNMSLTVAESGALALRVAAEAKGSLDYRTLRLRALAQEKGANTTDLITSGANASSVKHILYWNKWSQYENFRFGAGEEAFVRQGCAVSSCFATEDRTLVQEDQVDAIVFCLGSNNPKIIPVPPPPRYPNAKRVVFAREAPDRLDRSLQMYGTSFDYTVSYRYDSDARTGYGEVYAVDGSADDNLANTNFAEGKTKMAAWFVSKCNAVSMRSSLTEQLQRHGVTVDIYGSCGPFKCPKTPGNKCYNMLENTYKFYFSFENSLCNHYVSEKFNNILQYNVVPVTYGLGHELSGAPKDAYIDVFDFPDVKSLAQYLLYLNSNDTAYNEYFRWKKHYKVSEKTHHPFCKLCGDLHADPDLPQRKYNLQAWFSEGQCIDVRKNSRLNNFLGLGLQAFLNRLFW